MHGYYSDAVEKLNTNNFVKDVAYYIALESNTWVDQDLSTYNIYLLYSIIMHQTSFFFFNFIL